jgi:hypothetical protein
MAKPERFKWEECDGAADSVVRRGESKAQGITRLVLEARNERTTTLARNSTQPERLIQWNRSGLTFPGQLRRWGDFFGSATSAVPDRSEIGPYPGGGSGKERGSCHRVAGVRRAPGVGRCLRQRHVCGAGPLGDRSLPRRRFESRTRVLLQAGQGPASSGGRAMSPTAPRLRCGPLGDRSLPRRWDETHSAESGQRLFQTLG